jgi:hypothetical protein
LDGRLKSFPRGQKSGNAAKIPFSRPADAKNGCLKFNRSFEILEADNATEWDLGDAE